MRLTTLVTGLAALTIGGGGAASAQGSASPGKPSNPPCYPADGTSALLLSSLREIVSGADSISAKERTYGALPQGSASTVSVVTNNTTCSKLLGAYQAQAGYAAGAVTQIYAFQVGQLYVVIDTRTKAGEWSVALTFDSTISKVLARELQ